MFRSFMTIIKELFTEPGYSYTFFVEVITKITPTFTKKSVPLVRFSEKLPDDGHRRPKHVAATV
jgi:hypothetical protein